MIMSINCSNESVNKRNKRLQLDRVQHMKKQKQSKTVKMCNECICNTIKTKEEIYADLPKRTPTRVMNSCIIK